MAAGSLRSLLISWRYCSGENTCINLCILFLEIDPQVFTIYLKEMGIGPHIACRQEQNTERYCVLPSRCIVVSNSLFPVPHSLPTVPGFMGSRMSWYVVC